MCAYSMADEADILLNICPVILARDNRSSKPFIQKDRRIHIVEEKKKVEYFVLNEIITCRNKTFVTNLIVLFVNIVKTL